MYIRKITLKNIKVFDDFCWELAENEASAGWHVLLGDNGAGKSSFLRVCAVVMMGELDSAALRLNWSEWQNQKDIEATAFVYIDKKSENSPVTTTSSLKGWVANLYINKIGKPSLRVLVDSKDTAMYTDSFSASFGPYRRFTGGNPEHEKLSLSHPKLARHLSLFGEDVAFTETLSWLKQLRFQQLEAQQSAGDLLDYVIRFINQDDFLPNNTKLKEVNSRGVFFVDANGVEVDIEVLSDGYRSILSLTLELVRQFCASYPDYQAIFSASGDQIIAPGIVLIDEVDVHLHPRWQRRIGPWLTQHFPNVQFMVTTHSPLICQGANPGTITRLPQPGGNDQGGRVTGEALNRLLYGDILDAYGSGAFGADIERSEIGKAKYSRLAQLNRQARKASLSSEEQQERADLQQLFSITPDL